MQDVPSSPPSRAALGFLERLALGAALGALAGGAVGAYDTLSAGLAARDVGWGLLLAGAPGALLGLTTALVVGPCLAVTRWRPGAASEAAGSAALALVALAAALALVGTQGWRGWRGLALVLATAPVATLVLALGSRSRRLAAPWHAVVLATGGLLALVVGACGLAALRSPAGGARVWGTEAAGLALLAVAAPLSRHAPRRLAAGLALVAPAIALCFLSLGPPEPRADGRPRADARPSVVLVVLDTTRRDALGCYGRAGDPTPHLDRIAAEGAVFEDALSTSPWTAPSHASMFTGLYPVSHGCYYEHHLWLDERFTTLTEVLKRDGYQTAALYGNGYPRWCNILQGFDTLVGLDATYRRIALYRWAATLGFPAHWVDKGAREGVDELARWLAEERDPERPFFLFLNLFEPHAWYLPPLGERLDALPDGVGLAEATRFGLDFAPMPLHVQRKEDERSAALARALYDAEVRHQDHCLGEVLALLERGEGLDDTLLIVTADHGENLGAEGRWGHQLAVNEDLLRVPLVIRYPERFPAGTRVEGMCQPVDLPATVLDVLGLGNALPGQAGRSLCPDVFEPRAAAYAQLSPFYPHLPTVERVLGRARGGLLYKSHQRVMWREDLKYVWSSGDDHELYDLAADPGETANLVERMPELAERLDRELARWYEAQPQYVPPEQPGPALPVPEETLERLRLLGYAPDEDE